MAETKRRKLDPERWAVLWGFSDPEPKFDKSEKKKKKVSDYNLTFHVKVLGYKLVLKDSELYNICLFLLNVGLRDKLSIQITILPSAYLIILLYNCIFMNKGGKIMLIFGRNLPQARCHHYKMAGSDMLWEINKSHKG